jgi:spore coat protein U-like protein
MRPTPKLYVALIASTLALSAGLADAATVTSTLAVSATVNTVCVVNSVGAMAFGAYDGVVHLKSFGAVGKIHINLGDRDCSAMIVRQSVSGAAPGSAFTCG